MNIFSKTLQNFLYLLSVFVASIFLSACEKKIDMDINNPGDMLVLNLLASSGSSVKLDVSQSQYLYETGFPEDIADASVYISENGATAMEVPYSADSNAYLLPSLLFKQGSSYTVSAEKDGYPPISASMAVPRPIAVDDITLGSTVRFEEMDYWQINISFTDPEGDDYYMISLYNTDYYYDYGDLTEDQMYYSYQFENQLVIYDPETGEEMFIDPVDSTQYSYPISCTVTDPVLNASGDMEGVSLLFNDEYFNGKQITFSLLTDIYNLTPFMQNNITVHLYHITKDYYQYRNSVILSDFGGVMSAEPVQIYSNVNGGLGIAAAQALYDTTAIFYHEDGERYDVYSD